MAGTFLDGPMTVVRFVSNNSLSPKLSAQLNCLDMPLTAVGSHAKVLYHHGMVWARSTNICTFIESIFFFRFLLFLYTNKYLKMYLLKEIELKIKHKIIKSHNSKSERQYLSLVMTNRDL